MPQLLSKVVEIGGQTKKTFLQKLTDGWATFFKEPVALAVLAYAILWLSALSPHGVLLTAFLKDGWRLPEWAIGTFRGLGAVFGLAATVIYPRIERKMGVNGGSQIFLAWQSVMLLIALACFFSASLYGQIGFLLLILFSRIGLYGFSLGEMQIRQVGIRSEVRGQVNGFANALTGIATLSLYGAGALLPTTEDFKVLVVGSVASVLIAFAVYSTWIRRFVGKFIQNSFE
jgi:iron-regulated transporter 1